MEGLIGLPKAIPTWFAKGNLRLARRVAGLRAFPRLVAAVERATLK